MQFVLLSKSYSVQTYGPYAEQCISIELSNVCEHEDTGETVYYRWVYIVHFDFYHHQAPSSRILVPFLCSTTKRSPLYKLVTGSR